MTSKTYYLRHVPQSEYRSLKTIKDEKEKNYLLNLNLSNLNLKDQKLKKALITKINEEAKKIIGVVLPEDLSIKVFQSSCFNKIYACLGLK